MGLQVVITYQQSPRENLWRVLHDIEIQRRGGKRLWRTGMPEVHPLYDQHHSEFQAWAQRASFTLNPWFDAERWRDMYHFSYAYTNNQGFGMENDPRADFVNMRDLTKESPRVEALTSGGSLIKGVQNGDWVTVEALHFNTPVTADYIKTHPEFQVRGTYVGGTGKVFRMLGDKYEGPAFIHPFIVNNNKGLLRIEVSKLQAWTQVEPPDPLRIYL